VLLFAAFLIGLANYPLRVLGAGFDHLPGESTDNLLNNFVLEHGYRWLTGRADSFWDAPSFYPRRGTTAWSDAHIGMLPAYSALRAAGAPPDAAFQALFLIECVLNFAAAAWAVRRLGFGTAATAAAAYLFAFGLPVVAQTSHVQLIPRFLVPPAVVFGWEFLHSPRPWRLAGLVGCLAGQIYLTVYVGLFLTMLLAAGLFVAVLRFPHHLAWRQLLNPGRRTWLARLGILAPGGLAVLPLLARHSAATGGPLPVEMIKSGATVPASWLTAPPISCLHHSCAWSPLPELRVPDGEHLMFPGLLPIAAVLCAALLTLRPAAAGSGREAAVVAAWSALLLALLVTRFDDFWPYEPLTQLPGMGRIRVPGRIVLVLLFPAGVALAHVIDGVVRAARPRFLKALVSVGVALLVAAEQRLLPVEGHEGEWFVFRTPRDLLRARTRRIIEAVRRDPNPTLVYVFPSLGDGFRGPFSLQPEAMRAAQDLGLPCANGWSGYVPPDWHYFAGYRELMTWLTANETPAEQLAGLVVVGEPVPDADSEYEARMRATYPPQPVSWRPPP
jgi:hypothetical protein